MAAQQRITILLAARNGAAFLPEQLNSLAAQSFSGWDLIAGDDASTDATRAVLEAFKDRMTARGHDVTLCEGPGLGGAAHFLTLLQNIPAETRRIAFADQDDVWLPDKLERAHAALAAVPDEKICLYCSRTFIAGPKLEAPVLSRDWHRPFGFANALVQNIASGNTIVLNPAATALVRAAAPAALRVTELPAHDWWIYQLVTGAGGQVIHDPHPTLYYRQHGANQVGANRGLRAALVRVRMILGGSYARWNAANLAALDGAVMHLTAENRARRDEFAAIRGMHFLPRVAGFARLGLYRQTSLTQAALWLAVLLGRI